MKRMVRAIVTLGVFSSALATTKAPDAGRGPKPTPGTETHVLIVSGINKELQESQAKDRAVMKLRKFFLNDAQVDPARLTVLVDENSSARKDAKVSTAENLKRSLEALAASVEPGDRLIFYYAGQANIVAGKLRLNLPGKDVTHDQLAGWINRIKISSMLVVLDCPGAGLSAKALTGPERIVICGAKGDQPYSTRFSEYFLPALGDNASDTDADGKVSVLEAFTVASKKLDALYLNQNLFKTETPVLEDNGDGICDPRPGRYKHDKNDGPAASRFFLSVE